MPSCQGSYAATLLQPLPERVVVELDILDRSKRNLMLGDRFLMGVREAGVVVRRDANVLLDVTFGVPFGAIVRHQAGWKSEGLRGPPGNHRGWQNRGIRVRAGGAHQPL